MYSTLSKCYNSTIILHLYNYYSDRNIQVQQGSQMIFRHCSAVLCGKKTQRNAPHWL